MELINPSVVVVGIIVMLVLLIIPLGKKSAYKAGKKVANIEIVEQTDLYKKIKRRYNIVNISAMGCLLVAVILACIIAARPAKVEQINTELRNRDIFICLDTSTSVDKLNLDLCEKLKKVVKKLDGERFGVTIFIGRAVLLVPLTTDYDYVIENLDRLSKSIELSLKEEEEGYEININSEEYETYTFRYQGTLIDEGSSLIGDGLASCLYNFPDLEKNTERTRLIILASDNDIYGTQYVSLEEATDLCKKNNVKVYGIAPEEVVKEGEYIRCMEKTGGSYYKYTSDKVLDDLVRDIEKTDTSVMNKVDTVIYDKPEILFGIMIFFIGVYFVLSKIAKR